MRKGLLYIGRNQALEREFQAYSQNPDASWDATFIAEVQEALGLLAHTGYAAVVAEAHLAPVDAVEVLDVIMQRRPELLRVLISSADDPRTTLKCMGKGHHHILGPCDLTKLLAVLDQPFGSTQWHPSKAALELTVQMRRLPSPPKVYFQIVTELQAPDPWIERIGELIAQDPAVAAKVLQFANSAVFGLKMQVTHPREAVSYIGLESTKALVLMAHTFTAFERIDLDRFSLETLWRHCVTVGRFARRISRMESRDSRLEEESFTSGLLHDIGQLMLAANVPTQFARAVARAADEHRFLWETEVELFGASHADLGACLLGMWGLPGAIVEAVALHHSPVQSHQEHFSPLTAVHVANVLAHEATPGVSELACPKLDESYLSRLSLNDRLETWRQNCLETRRKESP